MFQIDIVKTEEEIQNIAKEKLVMFEEEKYCFSNKKTMEAALQSLVHFCYEYTDGKYEFFVAAVGMLHNIKGKECFFLEWYEEKLEIIPDDSEACAGLANLKQLTQRDCEQLKEFVLWDIKKTGRSNQDYMTGILVNEVYEILDVEERFIKKQTAQNVTQNEWFCKHTKQWKAFLDKYTPERMKEYLDMHIIGQDEAKKSACMAIYNHYLRILNPDSKLIKTNLLMIGPTGCGKTEIMRRVKKIVDVPVVIADFSGVVGTPWKGKNKEEALSALLREANMDVALAECGIVFIDEFDKILSSREGSGDIQRELQGQMLGMLEGTMMDVPSPLDKDVKISMNTKNILFICSGAFEGLEKTISKDRSTSAERFGYSGNRENVELTTENIRPEHLITYGFRSELVGRLSEIAVLSPLQREDMKRILTEPKESFLLKYENMFRYGADASLEFSDKALDMISDAALELKIGARALNRILQRVLGDFLYEAPTMEGERKIYIDENIVREKLEMQK